jgi:NAD-dependent SIR2 family protein deacetylase
MFNENRLLSFEKLEPTGKKHKKKRSSFFEYKVEVPKKNIDSMEKPKGLSEHKEILPLRIKLKQMKEKEKQEKEKAKEDAQKILDQLNLTKCPKCESLKIEETKDKNFRCTICEYEWTPKR